MHIDSRGWLSVAELVLFTPSLIVSAIVCSRHGFGRASGWIYTLILCLVIIIGASCQLATYSNPSENLYEAVIIIDSIGLSPLLFATLGLLSRLADQINASREDGPFRTQYFRVIQLLVTIGVILAIVGGTSGNVNADGTTQVASESKAAIIVLIVAFVAICALWLFTLKYQSSLSSSERRVSLAVQLSLPLIAVRLAYSALKVFLHNSTFNSITGSVAAQAGMAIVEEFIVVWIYLALGFMLETLQPHQQGEIAQRSWGNRKSERPQRSQNSRGGLAAYKGGLIRGTLAQFR
ncbi:hypothetical protein BT63DRAFT_444634 [Microthyrium microscopicum]|uniref:DUF7702 domain-containing protein n=1 Tax=Microthyrium microscopicum TaxID=703497 RepID=A0A6A6TVE6_9PEZI|nr:hypothetical protein BT63DRAFT_444634 [Microthyrium microscopicum]